MAFRWNPFKRRDKAAGAAPEPTPAPAAPPAEAPQAAPKPGLLGRLFGRKPKAAAPAPAPGPEAPPIAPAPAPEPPPTAPAEAPAPAAEGGGEGEGGGQGAAVAPEPERVYPSFLHVSAEGDWVISETEWKGTMSGTLHGDDVKTFIDAMEREGEDGPDYETAIPLIATAYGIDGDLIDVGRSTIRTVTY